MLANTGCGIERTEVLGANSVGTGPWARWRYGVQSVSQDDTIPLGLSADAGTEL